MHARRADNGGGGNDEDDTGWCRGPARRGRHPRPPSERADDSEKQCAAEWFTYGRTSVGGPAGSIRCRDCAAWPLSSYRRRRRRRTGNVRRISIVIYVCVVTVVEVTESRVFFFFFGGGGGAGGNRRRKFGNAEILPVDVFCFFKNHIAYELADRRFRKTPLTFRISNGGGRPVHHRTP